MLHLRTLKSIISLFSIGKNTQKNVIKYVIYIQFLTCTYEKRCYNIAYQKLRNHKKVPKNAMKGIHRRKIPKHRESLTGER